MPVERRTKDRPIKESNPPAVFSSDVERTVAEAKMRIEAFYEGMLKDARDREFRYYLSHQC